MFLINYIVVYYSMSKQQYRSEMGIMGDILDVTADGGRGGVIVSAISRKANLSHYAEKGLQFFQEFKRFQGLVESMNLRY
jgi:hypothetical protein